MIWLSQDQVIYLHDEIINATGGSHVVRDDGILQSVLLAPMQTYDGNELFPSVIEKAARLACGLTQFHPFTDGNKRIGAHSMLVVLELNGISLSYSQKELYDIFMRLADGNAEYSDLTEWVKNHLIP